MYIQGVSCVELSPGKVYALYTIRFVQNTRWLTRGDGFGSVDRIFQNIYCF